MTEEKEVNEHDDELPLSSESQTSVETSESDCDIIKMKDHRSGSGLGRSTPSNIRQGSRVQTSIGRGRGLGRFQSMQHQPRQEDHIPPTPPERGSLSRPPPPSVIRRPAIKPAPFEPPSRPTSRPRLIEGGTSAGTTHDSPSSSTHPSTSSSAPRQLPHVEMPHDPASPPELKGERDEPRICITIKNKRLHPSDTYFDWDLRITAQIMAAYKRHAKVRYKALMNKLLSKGERPIYVTEEAWRRYIEYWESDDFKARSKIASSNRQTEKGGRAQACPNTFGGSIPFLVHEERLSKKLGRDCTSLELYLHVHTKKHDGQTFIDARISSKDAFDGNAEPPPRSTTTLSFSSSNPLYLSRMFLIRIVAKIQRMREEMSQSAEEAGDDPHVDETDLYYKGVGVDHKGRVYGLGSTGRRYNDPGASSSQGPSSQDFATLQSNVSRLTSIVEDQQNQIQTQHEQIALLQSMLMQSMRGGHPGASSSHPPPPPPPLTPSPRLRPPPPPRLSHQENLTPPTAVPTPALDVNDVYRPRMYEPEDEEETNLPLQQEWIDALSDTHPLPRPDRDN
ncbi:hypothetical protein Sjap_005048 [Stephania japonica]|uniref:Uncharacterized protein n=1 Tax=Stephania japonica TaxID=461633 RepID=A0AAP0K4C5_9MAGN